MVSGTCRSGEKRAMLAADGVRAYLFDRDQPLIDAPAALDGVTDVLSSVPPDRLGDPVLDAARLAASRQRRGCGGSAISRRPASMAIPAERWWTRRRRFAPPPSAASGASRRNAAGSNWRNGMAGRCISSVSPASMVPGAASSSKSCAARGVASTSPGICSRAFTSTTSRRCCGPRSATRPQGKSTTSAMTSRPPRPMWLLMPAVCSGSSRRRSVPFDRAASELSPMALSFWRDNRRVDNTRMKRELGVELCYPNYRAGLAAIARALDAERHVGVPQ